MKVTALIAAAGKSERMGSPKALLPIGKTTFIRNMVHRFLGAGVDGIIVTVPDCNHTAQRIKDELHDQPRAVFCRNIFPERELLGSVQSAILDLEKSPYPLFQRGRKTPLSALLVMPVDVPAASQAFLHAFLSAYSNTTVPSILCTTHAGQLAHPILFSPHFFAEILRLRADDSLRTLLTRHQNKVIHIASDNANLVLNINTPDDYARFTNPSVKKFEAAAIDAPGLKSR